MMVLRAWRGRTGSKYVTLRGGRRAIPFLLVRSGAVGKIPYSMRTNGPACMSIVDEPHPATSRGEEQQARDDAAAVTKIS
jgi:hypothetical protein